MSIFLAAALAMPAQAQDVDLTGDVKVVRTVEDNGAAHETLVSPDRVVPGDKLVFVTRYHNTGAEPAEDFVVTNPLPSAVMLSADGDFDVSVDGGRTYGRLADLKVDGGEGIGMRAATMADVTHVRWTIARIAPGETGEIKYFAVVR